MYKQKKRKTPDRGHRLAVWIPEEDYYLLEGITEIMEAEELFGIRSSKGKVIRDLLREGLIHRLESCREGA